MLCLFDSIRRDWVPECVTTCNKTFSSQQAPGLPHPMRFTSAPLALGPLLLGLVLYRTLDALLVQTYFNPDEYWQGPEVAHQMAFGYGHLTWEWFGTPRLYSFPHSVLMPSIFPGNRAPALEASPTRCYSRPYTACWPSAVSAPSVCPTLDKHKLTCSPSPSGLDSRDVVAAAPRILQAVLAAVADLYTYR
jgi:hypothetical protein